ncbi:hypothetical protein QFC24_006158 [Naganishia onofrii]|uniref:Uncharacterized protein n=1 Tax=Naganishia onofrii TaxID=1851511 RepID=A0ACC2X4I7_9TREE|nr:hypothetical protein QFC24_006158 [Naganishia onofrii]
MCGFIPNDSQSSHDSTDDGDSGRSSVSCPPTEMLEQVISRNKEERASTSSRRHSAVAYQRRKEIREELKDIMVSVSGQTALLQTTPVSRPTPVGQSSPVGSSITTTTAGQSLAAALNRAIQSPSPGQQNNNNSSLPVCASSSSSGPSFLAQASTTTSSDELSAAAAAAGASRTNGMQSLLSRIGPPVPGNSSATAALLPSASSSLTGTGVNRRQAEVEDIVERLVFKKTRRGKKAGRQPQGREENGGLPAAAEAEAAQLDEFQEFLDDGA